MKIVRHNRLFDQEYRVYPFLKPDDNVSAFLPQYISVICEYGDIVVTSHCDYVDGSVYGEMKMSNAWQMVYKIALALQADYEAEIIVDETVQREVQS